MKCPKCNQESFCPCSECQKLQPDKLPKWYEDGNSIACGHCWHSLAQNEWLELTWSEYQKDKPCEKRSS